MLTLAVLKNVTFKVNLYKNSKMKVKTFFYSIVAFVGRLFSVVVLKKKKTLFKVTENVTFSIVHFQTHSVCSATNNKLSIYVNQINRISIQTACSCVLPSSGSPNVIRNINS